MSAPSQVSPARGTCLKGPTLSTRSTVVAVALAALILGAAGGSLLHFRANRYAGWGLVGVGSALLVGDVGLALLSSKKRAAKPSDATSRGGSRTLDLTIYKIVSWNARVRKQSQLDSQEKARTIAEKIEGFIADGAHIIALQKVEAELPMVANWCSIKAGSAALIYDTTVFKSKGNLSKTDCAAIRLRDKQTGVDLRVASVQTFKALQTHLASEASSTLDLVACEASDQWRGVLNEGGYCSSKDSAYTFHQPDGPGVRAHEVFAKLEEGEPTLTSRVSGLHYNLESFPHLPFSVEVAFAGGSTRLV